MDNDKYARYGALSGLVAVALLVVGFLIVAPKPPAPTATAATVSAYYLDHKDAIRASVLIVSVGLLFYIWFLGTLSSALRAAAGDPRLPTVAFGGGILSAVFVVLALTGTGLASYRPEMSPELVRALNDIGAVAGGTATGAFVALLAATGIVILRSGALPEWLGWLSVAGAVANLSTLGVFFAKTGAFAADGALGLYVPVAGFVIPIAALSIVLTQRSGEPTLGGRVGGAVDRVTGEVTSRVGRVTGTGSGQ
jgi:hypothetical protein